MTSVWGGGKMYLPQTEKVVKKMSKVICKICKQEVSVRKKSSMGDFPKQHLHPQTNQPCHGFYENGVSK